MQDRFALYSHILPPIDESQDVFFLGGEQENGYTVLEFSRDFVTCDVRDVNIKVYTVTDTDKLLASTYYTISCTFIIL